MRRTLVDEILVEPSIDSPYVSEDRSLGIRRRKRQARFRVGWTVAWLALFVVVLADKALRITGGLERVSPGRLIALALLCALLTVGNCLWVVVDTHDYVEACRQAGLTVIMPPEWPGWLLTELDRPQPQSVFIAFVLVPLAIGLAAMSFSL